MSLLAHATKTWQNFWLNLVNFDADLEQHNKENFRYS